MISILGESGFSVFHAGHCDWQRPHSVQVAKSSMPFQEKSSIEPMPRVVLSSRSSMSSRVTGWPCEVSGLTAPSATGRRPKSTFSGATKMCRCLEFSTITRNASITPMCSSSPTPSSVSSALSRQPVEQLADRVRGEGARCRRASCLARDRRAAEQEHRPDDVEDHDEDQPGATEVRAAEPGLAAELVAGCCGAGSTANVARPTRHMTAMKSCAKPSSVPVPDDRDRPLRVAGEEDAERLEVDRAEDHERPEDEEVRGARHRPLEQLALGEDLDDLALDRLTEPLGDVLDPVRCRLAAGDEPEQEEHPSTGHRERDGQHHQPDDQHPQIHSFSPFSTVRSRPCGSLRAARRAEAPTETNPTFGNFAGLAGPARPVVRTEPEFLACRPTSRRRFFTVARQRGHTQAARRDRRFLFTI